jgi:hypothetical protein
MTTRECPSDAKPKNFNFVTNSKPTRETKGE